MLDAVGRRALQDPARSREAAPVRRSLKAQQAGQRQQAQSAGRSWARSGEATARRTGPAGRCSVESAGGRWQGGQAGAHIRLEQRNERAGAQMRVGGEGLEREKRRVSG